MRQGHVARGRRAYRTRSEWAELLWDAIPQHGVEGADTGWNLVSILRSLGIGSNGASKYTVIMEAFVRAGMVSVKTRPSVNGRPARLYTREVNVYYNIFLDPRRFYREFSEFTLAEQRILEEKFDENTPWLSMSDWLYSFVKSTRDGLDDTYVGLGDRVLRISVKEAEEKRQAWRLELSGGMVVLVES